MRLCAGPILAVFLACALHAQSATKPAPPQAAPGIGAYAFGADISFLKQAEDNGLVYRDQGVVKNGIQILTDHGYNWVRLRVFVDPAKYKTNLPNTLDYAIALAKRAKAAGMKVEVGFHYSDTWSDRFHQITPSAWQEETHQQLMQSVRDYTRDSIAAFRMAGVIPDMLQIGNEPTLGFMWPDGRIPENWDHFADLYRAAIAGLDEGRGSLPRPLLLVQLDLGGDWAASRAWFDRFLTYHLPFDIIGQSYYAHDYHSLMELRENLNNAALRYNKDIIVIETSYTWTPGKAFPENDGPFPETPEGQAQYLEELNRVVMAIPDNHGKGVFWWEPFWPKAGVDRGMVDKDGNVLPALRIYDKWTGGKASRTHTPLATPQLTQH
jgi:arabinogalactan endo-1,4-beta-galactosidase